MTVKQTRPWVDQAERSCEISTTSGASFERVLPHRLPLHLFLSNVSNHHARANMCIEYETSRCTISLLEYRGTISTRLKGHLSLMKPLAVDGHTTTSDGVLIGTFRGPGTWKGRRLWPESAEEQAIAATAPDVSDGNCHAVRID